MWKVKIWIYSDDDFGFDETVFNSVEGEVREFYFEKREDAVKAILESFHSLKNTLRPCGRDHIKAWIDSFDSRIELITQKMYSFIVEKSFGNQELSYSLLEVKRIELPEYHTYRYETKAPYFDFSWYEEETLRWDELAKFEDVEKEDLKKKLNKLYVDIEEADKNNVNFHKEFRTVTLYLCIRCVLMGIIFLCAAIYFDKWWILLGTLCFAGGASMESDTPEKSKRGKEEEI